MIGPRSGGAAAQGNRGDGMEMYCADGFGQQKKKKKF